MFDMVRNTIIVSQSGGTLGWVHELLIFLKHRCAERSEQWSRWESEWRLEAEKHKAEAERLKGQVEALKETAGRHREEMRDKDSTLNR